MSRLFILLLSFFVLSLSFANAQTNPNEIIGVDTTNRVITTAVPFMTIGPDARSGGMGEVGAAISADANAIHWNVAKLPYTKEDIGFSLSYTPWLSKMVNDMSLSLLSGYMKIDKQQTVGIMLRYFNLGDFQFRDESNNPIMDFNPREFSFEGSYARMLSENMSIGITLKYIHSNLTGNVFISNQESQAGTSIAGDIGWYWNKDMKLIGENSHLAVGAVINNIGSKMTYSTNEFQEFIPTNFRLGSALTTELDPYNKITLAVDLNKLMVPSPTADGSSREKSMISGMFGSFGDAPDGIGEEWREIMWSYGLEYWYNDVFAARTGYYYENRQKGNRQYFTFGLGLRYNVFGIDFAYLVPTKYNHPLAETLRFTIHFDFNRGKNLTSVTDQNQN